MRRRALALALAGAALVLLGVAAIAAQLRWALSPALDAAPPLIFEVQPGASLGEVARELEARGVIRSALAFKLLARYRDLERALQIGEYELSAAHAPDEILTRIAEGRVVTYEIVLPEGITASQVAQRLEAAGVADAAAFLAFARDAASATALGVEGQTLEGYLFPETYRLPRGLSVREIAATLVGAFLEVWRELEPEARRQRMSMREVVTLASIVEKETAVPDERPLIAAVFRNRLERGMRLETDPTVIYGIPDFDGNLRRADLENAQNPYNTYQIAGLPPGPIANPGADSLRAVVHPAESRSLFFVSRNDGTHEFSDTYDDHVRAVNRYQRSRSR
ncbi:MAG TPA: endolytic transglycosylase MltG [Myxococcota bacterium]|nr:endolytic transglycosylase MltG [Myxococcota bacterium]